MAVQTREIFHRLLRQSDVVVILGILLIVVMMVIPMPPALLDVLLAFNISLSLMTLLVTMNVKNALEFSVFPSLLLVATLFRLALNISSTRLILLHGYAGQVIQAFGQFVVGGNYVVGFIIFLILVIIQFIVITRGAERVAEVAARFTLDAMPGKQMAIDADLNAGLIDEKQARERRAQIQREADFYGAMDGASKFVKGDAIASIIVTVINILGGFAVGVAQQGLSLSEALTTYTLLTVGDGLVTQIPALLMSSATGMIVTRAAASSNLGHQLTSQMAADPQVLLVSGGALAAMGILPGLPTAPFLALGGVLGGTGYLLKRRHRELALQEQVEADQRAQEQRREPEDVASLVQVDPLELEVGYGLVPLVDASQSGELLDRIALIRRQMAQELGLLVPSVRIRDNLALEPSQYRIKIKGIPVGEGELRLGEFLAMAAGEVSETIEGIPTKEPAFGLPALWIPASRREEAEAAGYTVVDPTSVVATHLSEVIRSYAHELLGRQEVRRLLDQLKREYPAVVEELVPQVVTVGEVQRVLQNLLREGVAIRDLVTILETMGDGATTSKNIEYLTALVREALARQISAAYQGSDGALPIITLEPRLEQQLTEALQQNERGSVLTLEPQAGQRLMERIAGWVEKAAVKGERAVLVCSPHLRFALRRFIERSLPHLPVLSYNEISAEVRVHPVGMVRADEG
ncbi:flagellar biosynthesis protein FlhA [Limnochorda pilosa]|uniref:flagellar biosynthesis protein FlhA n=1 Tax=Limnochorda pilosa TaxID=1555112 RepID=UPI001D1DD563|nr:flagellar biosynthesis protein FlhA [Limnochorda pilosa]MBO2485894.1 flagellar biosynthesis protein FlhA [Bacillota bacterium]MBO2518941.1 flagellar biosynthesis protein FlhA [Bacillota bacterium]